MKENKMKKDNLKFDFDPDRTEQLLVSKSKPFTEPESEEEFKAMVLNDIDIACMGLSGMIKTAESMGMSIQELMERVNNNINSHVFSSKSQGMLVSDYEKEHNVKLN